MRRLSRTTVGCCTSPLFRVGDRGSRPSRAKWGRTHGRIVRINDSPPICQFWRFCHGPARARVRPESIPDQGDRSDENDETDASVAFVSCAYCDWVPMVVSLPVASGVPRRSSRRPPAAYPADTLVCNHSATQMLGPRLSSLGRIGRPGSEFRCKWPQFS